MAGARQIRRNIVWFCCVLLAATVAGALDPSRSVKQYVHKSWTSADGLPESLASAIVQTHDGYLWFGTEEGIAKFDGRQFTIFDQANTPELKSKVVTALLEDQRTGALWIGTFLGGLTRYSKGQFQSLMVRDGLPDNYVTSLAQDGFGNLWIGTPRGLAVLRSGKPAPYTELSELQHEHIVALAAAPDGGMWLALESHVVKVGPDRRTKQLDLAVPDASALFLDRSGTLWIGTAKHGLYTYSANQLTRHAVSQFSDSRITALREDAEGSVWVGSLGGGVCRLRKRTIDCFTENEGLTSNAVQSIFEDHEGSLWIGTFSGIDRITNGKFTTYARSTGLSHDDILTVYQSPDGSIWAGAVGGLSRLHRGHIVSYRDSPERGENLITTIARDGKGNLWVGTVGGLRALRDDKLVPYGGKYGLATLGIRALLYDPQPGSMWIATVKGGLSRLQDGRLTTLTTKDGIASTSVHSMVKDHNGNLWFASAAGFSQLNGGEFTNYQIPSMGDKVSGGASCIYEDSDHVLWIGSMSAGLTRFQDGRISYLPMKEGLNTGIWSIVEDNSGYLWMTSNRGLFRIPKADLNDYAAGKIHDFGYISYGTADGLPSSEFDGGTQAAALRAADGKLYFANLHGVVMVDPEHMPTNTLPPPVVVENVTSGKLQQVQSASALVGEDDLQFQFAALSFVTPEDVFFKYKLEGYDSDWIFSRSSRASYTNLTPGKYRFRIMAANNDGVWNSQGATFEVTLKPVFYKTGWFIVLSAVGCVLGGVGINVLRIRRMQAVERRLVSMVDEQTRDLRQAKEAAEAATRAKSEFLANISHELRTPLNGVLGMLQVVKQTQLTDEQTGCLDIADQSASALLTLINDVLDFSKIEAGRMQLSSESFDPAEVIADAVRALATSAHEKRLELCCRLEPGMPSRAVGDPGRLKQVLLNLVGNAIKFTQKGEVIVTAETKDRLENGIEMHVCVADTGIGVAPEQQQMIFDSFSQADSSHTRRFGGTGLGLAISSRLTALMGGRIWVESELGKGARFHFVVLLRTDGADETQEPHREKPSFKGCSALIIDDNASSRTILQEMLESWDMSVVAVDSPAAAVAHLEAHACDVVLTDAEIPGVNCLEMVRSRARQDRMRSVIAMLTANSFHDQLVRCCEMGCAACLMKPVRAPELADAIRGILSPQKSAAPKPKPEPSETPVQASFKILLAEDNLVNQKLTVRLLEKVGHTVAVAENGKAALAQLESSSFDLVLMDVQMPEMDGLTATRTIREQEQKTRKHIPIVALTAHAMSGDREKCLQAGMDEYLSKPINARDLYQTINHVVASLEHGCPVTNQG